MRQGNRPAESYRLKGWWRHHGADDQGMWRGLGRSVAVHRDADCVAKHRLFAWLDARICPDHATDRHRPRRRHHVRGPAQPVPRSLVASQGDQPRKGHRSRATLPPRPSRPSPFPRDSHRTFARPTTSRTHVPRPSLLRRGGSSNSETAGSTRPEWVEWVEEPVPGYPPRPVPRDEKVATALKKRTLTNLYNARPQWLADAHAQLDAAVAAAYGWPGDITDDAALRELNARNRLDNATAGQSATDRRIRNGRKTRPSERTTLLSRSVQWSHPQAGEQRPAMLGGGEIPRPHAAYLPCVLASEASPSSPIHLAAVANGGDEHGASGVLGGVDDSVIAGSDAQQPVGTLNFHGLRRPRGRREPVDRPDDATAVGPDRRSS